MAIWTSKSPACSASPAFAFDFAHAAASKMNVIVQLVMLFMSRLRGLLESQVTADGALQLRQPLLVAGEVHRQFHLVHAQLARAVLALALPRSPRGSRPARNARARLAP